MKISKLLMLVMILIGVNVFAQDVVALPVDAGLVDSIGKFLSEFLKGFAATHPWLVSLIGAVGVLRVVMKPLMSFINAVVLATPSKADDAALAKVEQSTAWKYVMYVLDWFTSVKVVP